MHSDESDRRERLRSKILGFGERSMRKSYYPELQARLLELERFKAILDRSNDFLIMLEVSSGRLVDVNASVCRSLGLPREKLLTCRLREFLSESTWKKVDDLFGAHSSQTEKPETLEGTIENPKGNKIPVEMSVGLDTFDDSLFAILVGRDITERREAEEALRGSNERFRLLAETIQDVFWMSSPVLGEILYLSPAYEKIWGRSRESRYLSPKSFLEAVHPEDRLRVETALKEQATGFWNIEYRILHPDGSLHWIQERGFPIQDEQGNLSLMTGVTTDITEQKRLEEDLIRTQKMESIGVLAGGIAHDFNNILTAILGNISLAKLETKPRDPVLKRLEESERAIQRARELAHQLLTFSKGGLPVKKPVAVSPLIRDAVGFTLSGSRVRCEFHLPLDLWSVDADESQINQVLNNLTLNAAQAMPEGGIIRIRAGNKRVGSDRKIPLKPGNYVEISVEDRGLGIRKEHLSKVFDPYFSTKQKGSGLGLATAYSIVTNHEGLMTLESELGKGTTFRVYLPASKIDASGKKQSEERTHMGRGRILLMDDEQMVRDVAGQILVQLGYEVLFAREGAEAVEIYIREMDSGRPFDAVIMDLTIPGGLGGLEVMETLLGKDPNARVIVSSGYSNDPVMANFQKFGFVGMISKPYTAQELGRILHESLHSMKSP